MHALRIERLATGKLEKGTNNLATNLGSTGISGYPEPVSTTGNLNVEATFDLSQVFVELPAEIGETIVIGRFQDDVLRYLYGVQEWAVGPLCIVGSDGKFSTMLQALDYIDMC